jgi:hypothetical protein
MKINKKALRLIDKGLSANTVSKLSESQIDVLYSKMLNEQPQPQVVNKTVKQIVLPSGSQTTVGGVSVSNVGGKTTVTPTTESDLGEDVDVDDSIEKESGFDPYAGNSVGNDDGPSKDDGFGGGDDGMGMFEKEMKEEKESQKKNPYAICTAQLGKEFGTTKRSEWTKGQMKKYESCKADVEKSLKEGKNPVSLFLENEIMRIVERNIPPRITKGELVNYLSEAPATAPTKPKTKPGTKPSEKPKKPGHPLKNPNPGEKPAPKAGKVTPEMAKDEVIDTILKLLKNG